MKRLIKALTAMTSVVVAVVMSTTLYIQYTLPDQYLLTEGNEFEITSRKYISPASVTTDETVKSEYKTGETYQVRLNLPGNVSIKDVSVRVVPNTVVIACGTPFGIKMFTDGVMVVGMTDINTADGVVNPSRDAGIQKGDVIVSIDGTAVGTNEEVALLVAESGGRSMNFTVRRGDSTFQARVQPVKVKGGSDYRAGIWVRDSSAGIGTLTFYNPQTQHFGGLGHAVCDIDTGMILPLLSGEIVDVTITGAVKGRSGSPGELSGVFSGNSAIGTLNANTEAGVYGMLSKIPEDGIEAEIMAKQDITTGPATILATINGSFAEEFDITIEKINLGDKNPTKNMIITITDPRLLEATGGIVQGMSGSPILQNGKLIGAVTHVFVNDPTRGYAIFAETMLNMSNFIE